MTTIDDLETPAIVIDLARVEANLKRAQAHADANGYKLRPHTKTHKIPRFAQRQVELGAHGITVQKLGEAEVMADAGLTDIFVPYNIIGDKKLSRLKALNERITIAVTADSPDTVAGYAAAFARSAAPPLTVLVECDTGGARCGVQSPAQIGRAYGINSLGVIAGTLLFGWVLAPRLAVAFQLAIGALVAGIGFLLMKGAADYTALTTAGFVNGLGCGIVLPAMVTWTMRDLPVSRRGMGTGAFQSCLFFGMFLNPVLVVGLEKQLGGARALAVGLVGQVLLALAVLALLAGLLRKSR